MSIFKRFSNNKKFANNKISNDTRIMNNNNTIKTATLMLKDKLVADILIGDNGKIIEVKHIYDKEILPISIVSETLSDAACLNAWFLSRTVPNARPNIKKVMKKCKVTNQQELSLKALGISLNDQYWIKGENFQELKWDDINPYKNGFSSDLGEILFNPDSGSVDIDIISPDATTIGNDIKRWILDSENNSYIMKSNHSNEQVSCNEVLASEICKRLNIRHAPYSLVRCDVRIVEGDKHNDFNSLFAISKNFCTEHTRFATIDIYKNIVGAKTTKFLVDDMIRDDRFREDLIKMFVLDYLIVNEDRNPGNFGILIREDGKVSLAPVFDSGNSMYFDTVTENIGKSDSAKLLGSTHTDIILKFVSSKNDLSWYNKDNLKGIDVFYRDLLKGTNIPEDRQEKLCLALNERIRSFDRLMLGMEHSSNNRYNADIDRILNESSDIDELDTSPPRVDVCNGKIILKNKAAQEELRDLLERKVLIDIRQYPAYLSAKDNESR